MILKMFKKLSHDIVIKMCCNIFPVSNYIIKRKSCYDQTSDSEPSCLDSNRYSPDAFVHARGISCSRILRGRKCDFAVRTVCRCPVPCHSSSRFWHVGRCIVAMSPVRLHCATTCLWEFLDSNNGQLY